MCAGLLCRCCGSKLMSSCLHARQSLYILRHLPTSHFFQDRFQARLVLKFQGHCGIRHFLPFGWEPRLKKAQQIVLEYLPKQWTRQACKSRTYRTEGDSSAVGTSLTLCRGPELSPQNPCWVAHNHLLIQIYGQPNVEHVSSPIQTHIHTLVFVVVLR